MPRLSRSRAMYLLALALAATFFLAALTCIIPPRSFNRTARHTEVKEKISDRIIASNREKKETLVPTPSPTTTKPDKATKVRLNKTYGKLPLSFEANQGQTDKQVKFLSRGNGHSLFLAPTEMVMELSHPIAHSKKSVDEPGRRTEPRSGESVSAVLRMQLEGADPQARVTGLDELPGKSNYFIGNDPHKWRTDISNYAKVKYENAYPGIDLVYYGNQNQLEYDFIVASGADPDVIRLKLDGAQRLNIDRHGDLVLRVGQDEVRQHKPKIYQEIDGIHQEVAGRYVFRSENEIGFDIAAYDRNKALVIDPVIDGYSTFLGGSAYNEAGYGIAVDGVGRAYITGVASAPDFPSTSGPRHDTNGGDVFVARLSADGSELEYSTLIGGILQDEGYSIAVDSDGNAYATGMTNSPNFPTVKPYKGSRGSDDYRLADAFVTKLDATGNILYSTFLGGAADDMGYGIAVDKYGDFYVTGFTLSSDFASPVNSFQSNQSGGQDAFLAKFSTDGSTLLYFTYFGGSSNDRGNSIAVDAHGGAYITGQGYSLDMYTSPGAFQQSGEGFVAKFDTNASGNKSLIYSTHIRYRGTCVAVDRYGDAYVGDGVTVDKLNAAGSERIFSQYIGAAAIALDAAGNAYVTGTSGSLWTTPDAFQPSYGGGWSDAFMAKLSSKDGAIVYATHLGGRGWDLGYGIAVDDSGSAYVTGKAQSNFPTTPGAFQSVNPHTGGYTERYGVGFVTKIALAKPITPLIFIPGIAGSYLVDKNTNKNLWPGGVFTDHNALSLNSPNSNIIATDAIRTYLVPIVPDVYHPYSAYESLLGMLTKSGGYHEYQVNNDPARRTTAKCDTTQKDSNPNLFVFAYDWRKSNEENAAALKDYVGCVQQFYSGTKVNILAHSMGGLLARRYILDNPGTHNVDKLITIASPWLGAPKGIHVLETGEFPPVTPYLVFANTLKGLTESFPGMHELLPSKSYFDLGSQPFAEIGDFNRNNVPDETYKYEQLTQLLDQRHPSSTPGTTSANFHDNAGQDDWRDDQSGVEYHQIIGEQNHNQTIGQVTAQNQTFCFSDPQAHSLNCYAQDVFKTKATNGDRTVPVLSARRIAGTVDLAPKSRRWYFTSNSEEYDDFVEHTGLTQYAPVHDVILYLLEKGPQPSYVVDSPTAAKPKQSSEQLAFNSARRRSQTLSFQHSMYYPEGNHREIHYRKIALSRTTKMPLIRAQNLSQGVTVSTTPIDAPKAPTYYLSVYGTDFVSITDDAGHSNTRLNDIFALPVPNVTYDLIGERAVILSMPTNKTYTVTFRTGAYPIALEMLKGIDNVRPTQTIRYVDLSLPANVTAMLKITPQGVENLRYDKDGDGVFETEVTPTVSVTGAMAQDQTPPVIAFSEKAQGDHRLLTITAIDAGAGVKAVHYSLDGAHFYLYTEPLKIKLEDDRRSLVYAFADDGVANRSSFVKYKPLVPSVAAVRDAMSGEVIVNLTLVNNSTAAVVSNISLNSLRLNGKPTTTTLPQTIGTLAPGEVVTRSVRFPASAVKSTRAELSGTGTENGGEFGGNITITVPIP